MLLESQFASLPAGAQVVIDLLAGSESKWPSTVTVLNRSGVSEIAVSLESVAGGSSTYDGGGPLTSCPQAGAYLVPASIAGLVIPVPAFPLDLPAVDLKVHLYATMAVTVGIVAEY
jgi:hypothetical protein